MDPDPTPLRQRPELLVVADKRVEAAPDVHPVLDGTPDDGSPILGEPSALRRDSNQKRVRRETQSFVERGDNRKVPSEAQDVAGRLSCASRINDANHALRHVANAGVRRFRRQRTELPLRQNQEDRAGGIVRAH
jgi:hypothetical protein